MSMCKMSRGGQGGKVGHSRMSHYTYTEEIKSAHKKHLRCESQTITRGSVLIEEDMMDMFTQFTAKSVKDVTGVRAFGIEVEVINLPFIGMGLLAHNVPIELQGLLNSCGYTEFN